MQFLFIPHLVKDTAQKICLFTSMSNFLEHMNQTKGIRQECGIEEVKRLFVESDLRIEKTDKFHLLFKTFSYAVFLQNKLVGYSCIDFSYNTLKNGKYSIPNDALAQATKKIIAMATTQYGAERLFIDAGQLYGVYEWLDRMADADFEALQKFSFKFRAIHIKVKSLANGNNQEQLFWSINHVDSHACFLDLLMALETLTQTKSQRIRSTA